MSIWSIDEKKHLPQELTKDETFNTLIIGGGLTGMTTAYYLKDSEKICLIDSGLIGHGTTLNTTAKITYFQQRIYTKIAKISNQENASLYLKSQKEAINSLKQIIETEKIDCDLKKTFSYVFANSKKEIKPLEKEVAFLKSQNIKVENLPLPNKTKSYRSYCISDTYTFNPIKHI